VALPTAERARDVLGSLVEALSAEHEESEKLALDRVWVTPELRALVLPFRAPDLDSEARGAEAGSLEPVPLLQLASLLLFEGLPVDPRALETGRAPCAPLARTDRELVDRVPSRPEPLAELASAFAARRGERARVDLGLRAAALLLSGLLVLMPALGVFFLEVSADAGVDSLALGFHSLRLATLLLALTGVVSALHPDGGLAFHSVGIRVVRADGRPAAIGRRLARALAAGLPGGIVALSLGRLSFQPDRAEWLVGGIALGLLAFGALFSLFRPARGLQDRLARTALVPR
jgi:hypothetical protein